MPSDTQLPVNLKRAVVATTLTCRACGYDLRGCRLDVNCPECGLAIRTTLLDAVDSTATDMPRLHAPRAVGDALLWLMLCMVGAAVSVILPPTMSALEELFSPRTIDLREYGPTWLHLYAAGLCVASLWSCRVFRLPRRPVSEPKVDRDVRRIAVGMVGVGMAAAGAWLGTRFGPAARADGSAGGDSILITAIRVAYAVAAAVALHGTGGVLHEIGQRSRVYREARGGRQSTRAMIAAVLSMGAGAFLGAVGQSAHLALLSQVATFIVVSSTVMILIGLGYLVVNAWWIRRALRRPPYRMRDLIRLEVDTTVLGSTESLAIRQALATSPAPPTPAPEPAKDRI